VLPIGIFEGVDNAYCTICCSSRVEHDSVRDICKVLESGEGKGFFNEFSDDVDWIVEGTHPLAGHSHRKAEFCPRCSPFPGEADLARIRFPSAVRRIF
jgi:hypothetical protein